MIAMASGYGMLILRGKVLRRSQPCEFVSWIKDKWEVIDRWIGY